MSFLGEIKRRKVFRVAAVYAVVAWLIIQVVGQVAGPLALPSWFDTSVIVLLGVGFPIALILGWIFDLSPEGVRPTGPGDGQAPKHASGATFTYVIQGLVLLAVAFLIVDQYYMDAESSPAPRPQSSPARVAQFVIEPPPGTSLSISQQGSDLAIARDGSRLLFSVNGRANFQLAQREIDEVEVTLLSDTQALFPFLSADGVWGGYNDTISQALRRRQVNGGPISEITSVNATAVHGVAWGTDDRLIYGTSEPSGLWIVSATDGDAPELLTEPGDGSVNHVWPSLLPGEKALLFTRWHGTIGESEIMLLDLVTGDMRQLVSGGSYARYAPSGHIVYAVDGALRALPFDLDTFATVGDSFHVLDQVITKDTGAANFDISEDGDLLYIQGQSSSLGAVTRPVWIDLEGNKQEIVPDLMAYGWVRIAPGASRAAFMIDEGTGGRNIWVTDLARPALQRITSGLANESTPLWTPDGERIVYVSDQSGDPAIWIMDADGRNAEHLVTIEGMLNGRLFSWTPDGTQIVFGYTDPDTNGDIGLITFGDEVSWEPLIAESGLQGSPAVSPDGGWLAFNSNELGEFEIYVARFPDGSGKRRISPDSGISASWSRDGSFIFYRNYLTGAMMRVEVNPETMQPGLPEHVFDGEEFLQVGVGGRRFDFDAENERFLMLDSLSATLNAEANRLIYVQNWSSLLTRAAAVD